MMLPFSEKEVEINLSGWEDGLYLIRLVYDHTTVCTSKFIKQ